MKCDLEHLTSSNTNEEELKMIFKEEEFVPPYYTSSFIFPDFVKKNWKWVDAENIKIPILNFNFVPEKLYKGDKFNAILMPRHRKTEGAGQHRIFQFRFTHRAIGYVSCPLKAKSSMNILDKRFLRKGGVYRFEITKGLYIAKSKWINYKIFFCVPLDVNFQKMGGFFYNLTSCNFSGV